MAKSKKTKQQTLFEIEYIAQTRTVNEKQRIININYSGTGYSALNEGHENFGDYIANGRGNNLNWNKKTEV